MKKISEQLLNRLIINQVPFFANDNISAWINESELAELQEEVQDKVHELLDLLLIDQKQDHNTKDTARRVAKMLLRETLCGRYEKPPKITKFPNVKKLDELVITKAEVKSLCSHHFQNINGFAYVGILYGNEVMGLSKIPRIVSYFSRRPQIQEELVVQIADYIEDIVQPKGLGIVLKAEHHCVHCRGVNQDSFMTTSVMRGLLLNNPSLKSEFLHLIEMSNRSL